MTWVIRVMLHDFLAAYGLWMLVSLPVALWLGGTAAVTPVLRVGLLVALAVLAIPSKLRLELLDPSRVRAGLSSAYLASAISAPLLAIPGGGGAAIFAPAVGLLAYALGHRREALSISRVVFAGLAAPVSYLLWITALRLDVGKGLLSEFHPVKWTAAGFVIAASVGFASRCQDGLNAADDHLSLAEALRAWPRDEPRTARGALGCGAALVLGLLPVAVILGLRLNTPAWFAPGATLGFAAGMLIGMRVGGNLGFRAGFRVGRVLFVSITAMMDLRVYVRERILTLFGFVAGYFVAASWFAALYLDAWRHNANAFHGLPEHPVFGDFLYFSVMTMATVGYGDISPGIGYTRSLAVAEVMVGLVWTTLVLAGVLWLHERPRNNGTVEKARGDA